MFDIDDFEPGKTGIPSSADSADALEPANYANERFAETAEYPLTLADGRKARAVVFFMPPLSSEKNE